MFGFELWGLFSLGVAHGGQRLVDVVPQVQNNSRGALIVRVLNPNASQAPMIRFSADGTVLQLSCADDGAFPDATPNDSVFHCAGLLPDRVLTKQSWSSTFSTQGPDGEPVILGEFSFSGGGGFRFVTVNLTDIASSNSERFSLPSLEDLGGPVHVEMPPEHVEVAPARPADVPVAPEPVATLEEEFSPVDKEDSHVEVPPEEDVYEDDFSEVQPVHVDKEIRPHVEVPLDPVEVAPLEGVATLEEEFSAVELEEDAYEDDFTDLPELGEQADEDDYTEIQPEHEEVAARPHVEVSPLEGVATLEEEFFAVESGEVVLLAPPEHIEMPERKHIEGGPKGPDGAPEHIEGGPSVHVVVPPPLQGTQPPGHGSEDPNDQTGTPQPGTLPGDWSWKWMLGALALGWAMGQVRKRGPKKAALKRERGKEGLVVLPVSAIDGNGPTPTGAPVVIASASISAMATHMMSQLTLRRRVVVTGTGEFLEAVQGHPVLVVTDPDCRAIQRTLSGLKNDGGVPPVLFILGADSVIDSSGFSPTPAEDLLHAVGEGVWVALFTDFDSSPPQGIERWDYDPQAGWSQA